MHQICNLVYHILAEGRTTAQKAELDVLLSDPEDRERMVARQNAEAMKALGVQGLKPLVPAKPLTPAKPVEKAE